MSDLRMTAFRLSEGDFAIMDSAAEAFDLASRTEALRLLIRLWDGSVDVLEAARTARARGRRIKRRARQK